MPGAILLKTRRKTASRDFNAGFCPRLAKLSTGIKSHVVKENISRKPQRRKEKPLRNAVTLCVFSSLRLCGFAALREICCFAQEISRTSKAPCRTLVAALANRKVVAAKGALTVVTTCATRAASRRVMIQR